MSLNHVTIARHDDGIVVATISRPEALNALNAQVLADLRSMATSLAGDESISALIITGAGKAFVAGADIKAMLAMDSAEARNFSLAGHSTFDAIAALPFPVIAAINGFALGGGLELALSCDLIYASTKARLGLPEVGLGLIPGFGGTQRLQRVIGAQAARELIFTARHVLADEALRLGLVCALFEPDALRDEVMTRAKAIAAQGPRAVRTAKRLIHEGQSLPLREALALERGAFEGLFQYDEPRVGMSAFVNKETPNFRGSKS